MCMCQTRPCLPATAMGKDQLVCAVHKQQNLADIWLQKCPLWCMNRVNICSPSPFPFGAQPIWTVGWAPASSVQVGIFLSSERWGFCVFMWLVCRFDQVCSWPNPTPTKISISCMQLWFPLFVNCSASCRYNWKNMCKFAKTKCTNFLILSSNQHAPSLMVACSVCTSHQLYMYYIHIFLLETLRILKKFLLKINMWCHNKLL